MPERYASLKQGLVGAWIPSVSGSGCLLPDLSGRGNNGTLTNMASDDWVSSQYGRALDFDGTDDVVTLPASRPSLTNLPLNDFSMSFWCNLRSQGENNLSTFVHCYVSGGGGWYVLLRGVGGSSYAVQAGASFSSTDVTHISANNFFTANKTDHISLVFRSASKDFVIYRNATSFSFPQTSTASGAYNSDASNTFCIGNRSNNDRTIDGQLDDVRIYNRVLSDSEIRLLASEPGIGFKPAKKLSRFSQRFTYQPPKAKTYSVVRVKETDHANLREGLVGAWCPSIAGSGNLLPDQSGYGNHGTLTNMASDDWVSGQYGRALDFDGVDDLVEIENESRFDFERTNRFSVCFWARLSTLTPVAQIVASKLRPTSPNEGYEIRFFNDAAGNSNAISFILASNVGGGNFLTVIAAAGALTVNSWFHVGVTYDGSSSAGGVRIFLNGVELATTIGSNSLSSSVLNDFQLRLGQRSAGLNVFPLNGQLDDLRIYSRILLENEIRLLAPRPGIGLRQEQHRQTFYQFPSGVRRRLLLTGQT